jgi:hypothetical protein
MDNHSAAAFGAMLALLVGVWVMIDANKRGKSGIVSFLSGGNRAFYKVRGYATTTLGGRLTTSTLLMPGGSI